MARTLMTPNDFKSGALPADDCVVAWESDAAQEILKPRVGPERIEDRSHENGRIESRFIGLVEPDHRAVGVA